MKKAELRGLRSRAPGEQPRHKAVGEAIQAQVADWASKCPSGAGLGRHARPLRPGQVNLFRMGWVVDYADPDNFLYVLFHSSNKGQELLGTPTEFDKLVEEARGGDGIRQAHGLYRRLSRSWWTTRPGSSSSTTPTAFSTSPG